ncbi:hypothetical protein MKW94_013334 [Papaver nudicaule]|uniref:Acidic protein n=1 Tax=Papaver nudicaule TaxID=74823 RepID=A0AA41SD07_PAPNU|nr:hypothetical protein [Papaver nudicaule]
MEGKFPSLSVVMIAVLLTGLFLEQTPVEADIVCCNSDNESAQYYTYCRLEYDQRRCAAENGCQIQECKQGVYATNDFCKLGCISSVCSRTSELGESVKEAAERCNNVCNKKSGTAVLAAV